MTKTMSKTKTQTKCLRNPTRVTLVTLFRSYKQFFRGVSPFQDFFLWIVVHMWFRHRWKFCVFHHKKRVKFCIFFDKQLRVCLLAVRNKYSWYCHCYWFRPIGEYWWILILATATALRREGCWVTSQKQTLKHPWELFSPTPFTELERMLPSKDQGWTKQPLSAQLLAQKFVNFKN